MSTRERPDLRVQPPLEAGQRLDQPTFHARYQAMPPETRAELIGGVVYMPSPMRRDHGLTSRNVAGWLSQYQRFTPGVLGADNVSAILGDFGEPQPDCILFVPQSLGGSSRLNDAGFLTGPPELVIEISRSTRKFDLGDKKKDYLRAGVPEYVVIELDPYRVHWFVLRRSRYVEHRAGPDSIFRSHVFPGLWLDAAAFCAGDLPALYAALDLGLATPEHAAFAARLAAAERNDP